MAHKCSACKFSFLPDLFILFQFSLWQFSCYFFSISVSLRCCSCHGLTLHSSNNCNACSEICLEEMVSSGRQPWLLTPHRLRFLPCVSVSICLAFGYGNFFYTDFFFAVSLCLSLCLFALLAFDSWLSLILQQIAGKLETKAYWNQSWKLWINIYMRVCVCSRASASYANIQMYLLKLIKDYFYFHWLIRLGVSIYKEFYDSILEESRGKTS